MEYTGYHGTDFASSSAILKYNFRKPNKPGWLGKGIYFFENRPEMAAMFAETAKKIAPPVILKCKIVVENDRILDMCDDEYQSGVIEFQKQRMYLIEALREAKIVIPFRHPGEFNTYVFETLCERRSYILVRHWTYTYTAIDREVRGLPYNSFAPNAIELCVKNIDCIREKEMYELTTVER